jgi:hypothetical protein
MAFCPEITLVTKIPKKFAKLTLDIPKFLFILGHQPVRASSQFLIEYLLASSLCFLTWLFVDGRMLVVVCLKFATSALPGRRSVLLCPSDAVWPVRQRSGPRQLNCFHAAR